MADSESRAGPPGACPTGCFGRGAAGSRAPAAVPSAAAGASSRRFELLSESRLSMMDQGKGGEGGFVAVCCVRTRRGWARGIPTGSADSVADSVASVADSIRIPTESADSGAIMWPHDGMWPHAIMWRSATATCHHGDGIIRMREGHRGMHDCRCARGRAPGKGSCIKTNTLKS